MHLPELGSPLKEEHIKFLEAFAKSCRQSIVRMVTNAQSGHPGGSLSSLDYLAMIYAMRICLTNERVIVSHGHISPAVYSVLAELNVIPKEDVIQNFRKPVDLYEGHVNRKIQGVHFGTGPLAVGGSVASGCALADKLSDNSELTFLLMGDGENQEGQAYEMMNFANKYKLSNLVLFIDYNEVQLTDSLEEIMPLNIAGHYKASGWDVIELDGHDFQAMWAAIAESQKSENPTLLLGKTVMGKGVSFMEETGKAKQSDWHGKAPKPDVADAALVDIELSEDEMQTLLTGLVDLPKNIKTNEDADMDLNKVVQAGEPVLYDLDTFTDCRSAYGDALLDLANNNPHVVALTADVAGSVKTTGVKNNIPERHIECGIAEQHMVSVSGGLSIQGYVPFCSTFGAFMSSRAKNQARVNDLNECNVKMVATHCGLSVGEDGPTHQAIDDISSFSGFFHTRVLEPADPNQCDRMIRFVAQEYGNFYVRMGRSKLPIISKTDGSAPYYDKDYAFEAGKADVLREGSRGTIIAAGPMVIRAIEAAEKLGGDIEVIAVSSFIPFDAATIVESVKKTGRLVTVHDHNVDTGLAHYVRRAMEEAGLSVPAKHLGVDHYQLSGTADELYKLAGLAVEDISESLHSLL
ncbi:transketolase [Candidatus Peregrinibacteria bacterium]|nr:transketolase [Candidatus Peregrinibacteria bacterium]